MPHQEPSGYENEPEELFSPLPPHLYCALFHLEMSEKLDDCAYYEQFLKKFQCQGVLELGCGTGRIVEHLTREGYRAVGIDNSPEMLLYKHPRRRAPVMEMDMCNLGFARCSFAAVIIPHNTLNLLSGETAINRCLEEARRVMVQGGLLLLELFSVTRQLQRQAGKRLFQFALFDTPDNGKLVKETIRTYLPEADQVLLEERYKIRSFENPALNRNYRQFFPLAAFTAAQWIELIQRAHFSIVSMHSGYNQDVFLPGNDSTLLISASRL